MRNLLVCRWAVLVLGVSLFLLSFLWCSRAPSVPAACTACKCKEIICYWSKDTGTQQDPTLSNRFYYNEGGTLLIVIQALEIDAKTPCDAGSPTDDTYDVLIYSAENGEATCARQLGLTNPWEQDKCSDGTKTGKSTKRKKCQ